MSINLCCIISVHVISINDCGVYNEICKYASIYIITGCETLRYTYPGLIIKHTTSLFKGVMTSKPLAFLWSQKRQIDGKINIFLTD